MTCLPPVRRMEIDPVALAAEAELDASVRQAFGMHPCADPGVVEQIDGHLLEDAGADAAEHVVGRALLEDDRLDPGLREQRGEQKARRTGADDRDLRSHGAAALSGRMYAPPCATCARHAAIGSASRARARLRRRRGSVAPSAWPRARARSSSAAPSKTPPPMTRMGRAIASIAPQAACGSAAAQLGQNFAPGGASLPQAVQKRLRGAPGFSAPAPGALKPTAACAAAVCRSR